MTTQEKLREEFVKEFYISDTFCRDDDYPCASNYFKCEKCSNKVYHYVNSKTCAHNIKDYIQQACNCGAVKNKEEIADFFISRTIPLEAIRELEGKLRIAYNYPCSCIDLQKKCEHDFTALDLALKLVRELLDNNTKV